MLDISTCSYDKLVRTSRLLPLFETASTFSEHGVSRLTGDFFRSLDFIYRRRFQSLSRFDENKLNPFRLTFSGSLFNKGKMYLRISRLIRLYTKKLRLGEFFSLLIYFITHFDKSFELSTSQILHSSKE